jgi:hypothetical protein
MDQDELHHLPADILTKLRYKIDGLKIYPADLNMITS